MAAIRVNPKRNIVAADAATRECLEQLLRINTLRGDAHRKIAFFAEFFSFEILPVKLSLFIQLQLRKRSRQNSNEKLVKILFYSATVARESASFVANQQLSIVSISRMRRLPPLLFAWRG